MNIDFYIKQKLLEYQKPISDFLLIKEYVDNQKYTVKEILSFLENYCTNDYPIQYLVGYEYFFDKKILVSENVLIPRMETEEVVLHLVKSIEDNYSKEEQIYLLDMCTGSGNIIIGINKYLYDYNIKYFASDISKEALKMAKKNCSMHSIDVNFIESDLFEKINDSLIFDVIISNPPYIAKTDKIDSNVYKYEPHLALFANNNGLEIYEKIIAQFYKFVSKKFILCFEIGYNQGEAMENLSNLCKKFDKFDIICDMNNNERVFLASKGIE